MDPAVIAAMSEQQFLAAVHGQLVLPGGKKLWRRIALAVHAAAAEPGGIAGERAAIAERAAFALADWNGSPGSPRRTSRYRLPCARSLSITRRLTLRQVTCHHLPAKST